VRRDPRAANAVQLPRYSPDCARRADGGWRRVGSLFAVGLLAGCSGALFWGADEPGFGAAGVGVSPPAPENPRPVADLIGLGPESLQRLLGEPRRQRRDAPAQLWQYVAEDCLLDLFLYDEPGGYRVTYVEARTRDGEAMRPDTCFEAVRVELAEAR
jgi:hypothetical protein